LADLRKDAGLSQAELAKRVGTSQQQISRHESANYEGHSLSMLRRVADVLGATVKVQIYRQNEEKHGAVAEPRSKYKVKSSLRRRLK
jgi:transcriptional regulator with XRE-family HTH domain